MAKGLWPKPKVFGRSQSFLTFGYGFDHQRFRGLKAEDFVKSAFISKKSLFPSTLANFYCFNIVIFIFMFEISHNLKKIRVLVYLWIYQHGSYKTMVMLTLI